ncbi:MAG: hypothetical protein LBC62_02070 [Treponema sp.]|jgi:hypothetical protein|nr:hypothetical protein [Treponema sp.]
MEILINSSPADITLENEKTIGDVLAGMEQWLAGSGNRLSGLLIDGKMISARELDGVFGLELKGLKTLDIRISSWQELAAEALGVLRETCNLYASASFEDRSGIYAYWESSPAAAFLADRIPDMAAFAARTFQGEGLAPGALGVLAEERLRELGDPAGETAAIEGLVSEIAARMEDLPLDIQTGKDARAAETMQLFSRIGEKLFRILFILRLSRQGAEDFTVNGLHVREFMDDFNAALKELTAAYENRDSVLIGDLAEYEMAPRLIQFYSALKERSAVSTP